VTTTVTRTGPRRADASLVTMSVLAIAGCWLLVARPWLHASGSSTLATTLAFAALACIGVAAPVPASSTQTDARRMVVVTAAGVATVALVASIVSGRAPVPIADDAVVLTLVAAIVEEAFFRRFLYALLRPAGAPVAIGVTAALFALVHVTVYGWWVVPIDFAAGLLFGWQREAAGTWWSPAITHFVANLCVVL
jgi:membrane protease YdiL (CAAX protease family)